MRKQIITISREFGSGGREVGEKLAKALNIAHYDKNILDKIAEEKGYSREMMEEDEKKAKNSFLYSLSNAFSTAGYGPENLSINEKFFLAQFDFITELAKKEENCVIVGRCADYVLRDYKYATNVFVYGEEDAKIQRATSRYDVSEDEAKKMMAHVDKSRANYYRYHTGNKWGEVSNFHLAINSSHLSIDSIVKIILEYVKLREEEIK